MPACGLLTMYDNIKWRECPVCDDPFVYIDSDYCLACSKVERPKRPLRMKPDKFDSRKVNKPNRGKVTIRY